ncbi:MAG TPA: hypothetical protein VK900_07195 [Anaerolineales bacterium]|nr:hypothetical protein [Anaerolineales bacterium]
MFILHHFKRMSFGILLTILLAGCLSPPTPVPELASPTAVLTSTHSPVPPTGTATQTPTPSAIPSATSTPEPLGCQKPPEDYTRLEINGQSINRRTLAMLEHAQALYGGEIELTGYAITQGSYTESVAASFGTHAGGGAVDISVLRRGTYAILWDDIGPVLSALRLAGFAAWLREYGELHADSPIHIHAIAIGDQELSPAAEEQLTGEAGYFRGYSGLPVAMYGAPTPDRYGGPIICQWMIELGYTDLR